METPIYWLYPILFGDRMEATLNTSHSWQAKLRYFPWGCVREFGWGSKQHLPGTLNGVYNNYQLVGGLEHFLFSHILGIIIPID